MPYSRADRLPPPATAAAQAPRVPTGELDELLDHANDTGRKLEWGVNARGKHWVRLERGDRGWDEAVGPSYDDAARTLLVLVVRTGAPQVAA